MGNLIPIITFCSATIHALNLTEDLYSGKFMPHLPSLSLGKFKTGLIENSML